jgi:Bacterial pre-peptidase C-terminal domain
MTARSVFTLCVLCVLCGGALAASPTVTSVMPRGGQRNTEVAVTFGGARLADAQELMWYPAAGVSDPGHSIAVTKLEAKENQVVATLKIAAACPLGEHAVRLRSASGLSELRTFWVGALPVVDEKEPNNDFAVPQPIPLNCTVHGTVTSEDVDYFAIEAKKGQRISVEIEGLRLASNPNVGTFDPFIAILDAKRFELATSDDTPLLLQDGCLSIVAPADGKYIVQVRESAYRGSAVCHYRMHVGTFPRPTSVFPLGGKPGEEIAFRFLGDPTGDIVQKIKLPATPADRWPLHAEDAGGISPSGIQVRVNDLPNVLEVEPNDAPPQATKGDAPCAFNGVIGKASDHDHFKIAAKAGQTFDVTCYARRLGSPLDPVIWILNPAGAMVASNDDIPGSPDSYLRFTAPADGEFVIGVRDHLYKGGPTYAYRIEVAPVAAKVAVSVPQFAQFSQDRQWIIVPRGNRYATLVTTTRADVGGELTVEAAGLPAKVSAATEAIAPYMGLTPAVIEAAADAPLAGSLAEFVAKPVDPKQTFTSRFRLRSELVYGTPNNATYWSYNAQKVAVSVAEAVPFKISIVEPKVPLVHNGSMNLKIVAERQPGFTGPITIYPLHNPPGVGSAGAATIAADQTETVFPLNANTGAPVRKWKYVVWGVATVGNGPVWVSSQLATVEIAPPYLALNLERAMGEQGKTTTLYGKVNVTTPWEGPAKVQLIGLPAKVTTPIVDLTKDAKEIAFPLTLDAAAPAGQHKNLFCQVIVTQNGEPVVQNLGSTELRVDKPLVAAAPTPAAAPKPAAAPPAGEKRLTRLEQLRKEQEEREKAQKKDEKKN